MIVQCDMSIRHDTSEVVMLNIREGWVGKNKDYEISVYSCFLVHLGLRLIALFIQLVPNTGIKGYIFENIYV